MPPKVSKSSQSAKRSEAAKQELDNQVRRTDDIRHPSECSSANALYKCLATLQCINRRYDSIIAMSTTVSLSNYTGHAQHFRLALIGN